VFTFSEDCLTVLGPKPFCELMMLKGIKILNARYVRELFVVIVVLGKVVGKNLMKCFEDVQD
jgi:hypothetical protein